MTWAETVSYSGHFSEKNRKTGKLDDYTVTDRWLEVSTRGYISPLYKISKDNVTLDFVYEYQIRPFPPD